MVLLFALALAGPPEPSPVPPPAPDGLSEAQAVAVALGRVQNQWMSRSLLSGQEPCTVGAARSLLTRSRLLGAELHRRVEQLVEAAPEHPEVLALQDSYLAGVAFQSRVVEREGGDCPAPLTAAPGVGPAPVGDEPVAIIALMGVVCPGTDPADGGVMVVHGPVCTMAFGACDCTPRAVLPGEVLAATGF